MKTIFEQHAQEIKGKENLETASSEARTFARSAAFALFSHKLVSEMMRCDRDMRSQTSETTAQALEASIRRRTLVWAAEQYSQVIKEGKEETV